MSAPAISVAEALLTLLATFMIGSQKMFFGNNDDYRSTRQGLRDQPADDESISLVKRF